MDRYGELGLNWAFGYKGSRLQFVNDVVLVYSCGNTLSFIRDNGTHVMSLPSHGSGVGPIAVCHKLDNLSYIAYAETKLNPAIFIIHYPTCGVRCLIKGSAILEYIDLAFSTDGKKLVSLSGVPDFHMTLWDCSGSDGVEICSVNVGEGNTKISINPLNWKQISLFGPSRITLWSLEVCGTENLLTPVEVELPEITADVGTTTTPKIPPPTTFVSSDKVDLQAPAATSVGLFVPPNMSEVLYKESYNEFVRLKEPMEPRALCWTPKQSIYVGCGGGQLMMVDFDSGCVTVMVNPQQPLIPQISDESLSSSSKSVSTSCTAHALLKEGATDCLVLSRRGLFTAGRSGLMQCFDINNHFCLVDEVELTQPIHQLACSAFYSKLALGMGSGAIYTTELLSPSTTLKLISNHHHAELVGLDVLCPGADRCVTCRRDGKIQAWNILNGDVVSSSDLNTECTCISCPVSCKVAMVGAVSGHVYMISLVTNTPKLKVKRLMHNGPVTAIKHDQAGNFMASISAEGPVFFYNSKPSTQFEVLGYIESVGSVLDISLLSLKDGDSNGQLQAIILSRNDKGCNSVMQFQVDNSILEQKSPELYADAGKKFSSDLIQCTVLDQQVSTLTLAPEGKAFSILNKTLKFAEFILPQFGQKDSPATLVTYKGHDLDYGKVAISHNKKWVASIASDGKLLLRLAGSPGAVLSSTPHHYQTNGCQDVVFSRDNQYFMTIGDSGTITCWKLKYSDYGETKSMATVSHFNKIMEEMEDQHTTENKILKKMKYNPADTSVPEKTWFILAREETDRTKGGEFSEIKAKLNEELSVLREKVLAMIAVNENLPDIEKLGRQEFILDTEDYQRMLGEEKQLIANVREEVEFSNLAAMFLKEQIKKECWDKMTIKGRSIKAFQARTEVTNFPLVVRTTAKLKELEKIKTIRKIDIMERKIRKEASSELKQTLQPFRSDEMLDDEDMQDKQAQEEEVRDPNSLLGSDRALYGGSNDLLIHQFELHSRVYQKHQIALLEDCIYMVRENFNKEFDEVMRLKTNEIARIKEKNVRIAKIISQLKLDDPLVQPSLSELEEPERLLMVEESEIKVEKYISPEEEKRLEEAAKEEEERLLAAKGDNPRERALDMMMGGRLEANVEEDLFKDLPRPEYMCKDPAEMSEEEIRLARDFEKKEEAFLEEREKLKKALEAELRKLQASIIQGMEQFDERLVKLFQRKIRTQMVIHQDELKMLHLACSLVTEKEVGMKIQEFNDLLQEKKVQKIRLGAIISEAKGRVEEVKEQYDILATEDKEMDRAFKKEFADCEPYVDQLYKLFRRRPRGQKPKGTSESVIGNPKSQDMFAMRPSSSGGSIVEGMENPTVHPMAELDHSSYMPEGLELYQWERFVLHRHKKVDSEGKVKTLALELAEMHSFLQRRQNEESRIQQEIQDTFKDISKLQEDKIVFDLNLEIQFLLKQGQVEMQMNSFIPNYSSSVMVHRSKIEELNTQIKTLGEAKLNSMMECKDFKRGIRMLEWEKYKMELEQEGLLDKARDIQMMRVTRDLLQRLHEKDLFSKDIREKETLENTMEFYKKAHKKSLHENSAVLKELSRLVKAKIAENRELDLKLRELQVSVAERAQIEKLADVSPSEANREQRMKEIVMRRKLVETIKSQDEEYSILKSEMERLRMKTFPALVQVD